MCFNKLITNYLLLIICLFCYSIKAIAKTTIADSIINLESSILDIIELQPGSIVYATKTTATLANKGAIIIQATATGTTMAGIIINSTADGTNKINNNQIQLISSKVPALTICATPSYAADLTITRNLTIGETGFFTGSLLIDKIAKVTTNIYNKGTIIADTCIQIGNDATTRDFILNGDIINTGKISAKTNGLQGIALSANGAATADINSFKFINSGNVLGEFKFTSDANKPMQYCIDNQPTGIIETKLIFIANAKLALINAGTITAVKLARANKEEITLTNKLASSISFARHNISITAVSNDGTIHAEDNFTVEDKCTNNQNAKMNIGGKAVFAGVTINSGTIKVEKALVANKPFTNNNTGVVNIGEIAIFHNDFTNNATAVGKGITFASNVVFTGSNITNAGSLTLQADVNTTNKFTNQVAGTMHFAKNSDVTFAGNLDNYGIINVDHDITFDGQFTNNNITNINGRATFSNGSINNGQLNINDDVKIIKHFNNQATGMVNCTKHTNVVVTGHLANQGIVNVTNGITFDGMVDNSKNITIKAGGLVVGGAANPQAKFTNDTSGVVDITGVATFNGNFINLGQLTVNGDNSKVKAISVAHACVIGTGAVVNINGYASFYGSVINDGCLAIEARNTTITDNYSGIGELVVKLKSQPKSNATLLKVGGRANFKHGSNIILVAEQGLSSLYNTKVRVIQAQELQLNTISATEILGSFRTNSILFSITSAKLNVTNKEQAIVAEIESKANAPAELNRQQNTLATFLLKPQGDQQIYHAVATAKPAEPATHLIDVGQDSTIKVELATAKTMNPSNNNDQAAMVVNATETPIAKLNSLDINGIVDGSKYQDANGEHQLAPAVPAVLVCADDKTTGLAINNGLTIGPSGRLVTGLLVKNINKLTGNIDNKGSIRSTANNPAIKLAANDNNEFILDGDIHNYCILGDPQQQLGSQSHTALDVNGKATDDIKTFSFTNSGTIRGKFHFASDAIEQMEYSLHNDEISCMILTDNITVDNAALNIINDAEMQVNELTRIGNSEVNLINNDTKYGITFGSAVTLDNLINNGRLIAQDDLTMNTAAGHKFINNSGATFEFATCKHNSTFTGELDNKQGGIVNLEKPAIFNGIVVNKGELNANDSTTVIEFQDAVINYGNIQAKGGLIATNNLAFTNNAGAVVDITGVASFGEVINDGCLAITAEDSTRVTSYAGMGELVIKLSKVPTNSKPLLTVTQQITFNEGANISLVATEWLPEFDIVTDVNIIRSNVAINLPAKTTVDAIVGSIQANSIFLHITNAKLNDSNQAIIANIEAIQDVDFINLAIAANKLATSLFGVNNQRIAAKDQPAQKFLRKTISTRAPLGNGVHQEVNNLKTITADVKATNYIDALVAADKHLTQSEVSISQLVTPMNEVATNTTAKAKIKDTVESATKHAVNKEDFVNRIVPESSNLPVTTSYAVSNKLVGHLNARMISKSNTMNNTALMLGGINSGAIADDCDIWLATGYHGASEFSSKDNNNYSWLRAWVMSIGLDISTYKNTTLGISYACNISRIKLHSANTGTTIAEDNITTNALALYVSRSIKTTAINTSVIYAYNHHNPKVSGKYNSYMFSLTTTIVYPISNFSFSTQLGFTSINAPKHNYGSSIVPDKITNLVCTGVGVKFHEVVNINNNVKFHYNLGVHYKLVTTVTSDTATINILATNPNTALNVNYCKLNKHNLDLELLAKLQLYNNLHLDADINYSYGKHNHQYGVNFAVRYLFGML